MSEKTNTIFSQLELLGLDSEQAVIYYELNKKGASTALSISRSVGISRTKVYRILDTLMQQQLVAQVLYSRGFKYETTGPEYLENLIKSKQQKVFEMQNTLPLLLDLLDQEASANADPKNSEIRYFKGKSGLEQITYNSLRADKELLIFEMEQDMQAFTDEVFAEMARKELARRKIHVKQLTNLKSIKPHTKVKTLVEKYWHPKYISSKVLKLSYEVLIYNDVVAMYNVRGNNLFGLEIHNKFLAEMQRQLFEFTYSQALEMEITSSTGSARLKK